MLKIPIGTVWLVLVVLIISAGYLVWLGGPWSWPAANYPDGGRIDGVIPTEPDDNSDDSTDAIVDDSDPPDWQFSDREAFFIEYRLERERVRSREIDILQQMINNPNVTTQSKQQAEQNLLLLQTMMETELLVENAVKAQGYKNAVMIMHTDTVTIVVDAAGLTRSEVNMLARMVSDATGVAIDKVIITSQASK